MFKLEIINQLHKKHSKLKHSQVESILTILFNEISESLIRNQPVELRGFGKFTTKTIKAKPNARNPKTGEIIYVPEKKKVSFKMSKHLKEYVNS